MRQGGRDDGAVEGSPVSTYLLPGSLLLLLLLLLGTRMQGWTYVDMAVDMCIGGMSTL